MAWVITFALAYPGTSEKGQLGDTFGVLNSLFSGLALAAVAVAIFLQRQELINQRKELRLQREELKLTRKEMGRAASAQEKSVEALTKNAEMLYKGARVSGLVALSEGIRSSSMEFLKMGVETDDSMRKQAAQLYMAINAELGLTEHLDDSIFGLK